MFCFRVLKIRLGLGEVPRLNMVRVAETHFNFAPEPASFAGFLLKELDETPDTDIVHLESVPGV